MAKTFGQLRSALTLLPCGVGVDLDIIDDYVNQRYMKIINANHPWTRLEVDSFITVVAEYTTGTIAILKGGTTFTLTGGTFTAAMQDRKIRIASRQEYYVFTFVDAATGAIDKPYEGDDSTAAKFQIFQNIYSLPAPMEEIASLKNPRLRLELDEKTIEYLDEIDPNRISAYGQPYCYAPTEDSSLYIRQIELYPSPIVAESYPIRGKRGVERVSEDLDQFLPWVSIEAITAGVEADLLALKGDLSASDRKETQFNEELKNMIAKDTRRMPVGQLRIDDRYTAHRQARTTRGRIIRNWRAAE